MASPDSGADMGFPLSTTNSWPTSRITGHQDKVVPFPNTTANRVAVLQGCGRPSSRTSSISTPDTTSRTSSADLRNWWPLVRPGGAVFGDDFSPNFPGVEQAVRSFCAEMRLPPFQVEGEKWVLRKPV